VERLVLRPLIGEPIISIIMVTIGLTYILRGGSSWYGATTSAVQHLSGNTIDLWG